MSSLSSILNIASSGLQTSQTGLRTVSDNVTNVDTPGYIRKVVQQQSVVSDGRGAGVDAGQLKLAADRFLQAAGLQATSDTGATGVRADTLDQAQALFGDPNAKSSFFTQLNGVFSSFAALSSDSSNATRASAISSVQGFLDQASTISSSLDTLGVQTDAKVNDDVATANDLLKRIDALNADISRATATGRDATGSQNAQSGLIDQLSSLMDVRVSQKAQGGVVVRASDGLPLAGDGGAATLSYDTSGGTGRILVTTANGAQQALGGRLQSGELKGLLDLRNGDLPALSSQLAELVSGTAQALNAAHNASSTVPAPASLTGRTTALSASEAFSGFTGKTTIAITDATGAVQRKVDIDFDAGTLSVNGGPATAFTAAGFPGQLTTALGTFGSASFSASGQLTLSATGGNGVAAADSATAPTAKAGRGFAAFFGLNDLVTAPTPTNYATGLTNAATAGFSGNITLRLTAADGSPIKDVTVNAGSATTMASLVSSLNSSTSGVGLYGSFALDDATGKLAFTPSAGSGVTLSVPADTTARGAGGPSVSALFGIGDAVRAGRADAFSVRSDIAADPSKLSLARLDPTVAVGTTGLYKSDASGADALAQAGRSTVAFDTAGGFVGGAQTLSNYAANLSSAIANRAASASNAKDSATTVATQATARRSSAEGVNLDQELVAMTTYQQAYNASARMVQAVRDLYDVLLNMV